MYSDTCRFRRVFARIPADFSVSSRTPAGKCRFFRRPGRLQFPGYSPMAWSIFLHATFSDRYSLRGVFPCPGTVLYKHDAESHRRLDWVRRSSAACGSYGEFGWPGAGAVPVQGVPGKILPGPPAPRPKRVMVLWFWRQRCDHPAAFAPSTRVFTSCPKRL